MEIEGHGKGLDQFAHAVLLGRVVEKGDGVSRQVATGVVDFAPDLSALCESAVAGVETECGEEANRSRSCRKVGCITKQNSPGIDKFLVIGETGRDRPDPKEIGKGQPLNRAAPKGLPNVSEFAKRALVPFPAILGKVQFSGRFGPASSLQPILVNGVHSEHGVVCGSLGLGDIIFGWSDGWRLWW